MPDPGPFGVVANLLRWAKADSHVVGASGPLAPPRSKASDTTDVDFYQGMADGWLHGTVGAALSSFFSEPRTRKELYVLFEKMDMTDIAGAVLDQFAADATVPSPETKRRVWVESQNDSIVAASDAMFKRTHTEEELPALVRDLAKFGDVFERLVYNSGLDGGVMRMLPTPPLAVTRKEDKNGTLTGFLQAGKKFRNENSDQSYPWDFTHFRLRGRDRRYPYGTSVLQNGIRPWKSFVVLDDWMMGYQTQKHPDRFMVLLDVGTASDHEAVSITKSIQQKFRKHIVLDPAGVTGSNMRQRYDAHSPLQDLVIPIRTGSTTSIQRLQGSSNATDIVPLQHMINRFYGAVCAPKEFFGQAPDSYQQNPVNMKASLSNQDIRYARTVKRVQHGAKLGYRHLCELNLMLMMSPGAVANPENLDLQGLDFRLDGNDFTVHMGPVSFLDELESLEVEQTRQQVAIAMMELSRNNPAIDILQWTDYILREIVKVPEGKMRLMIRKDLAMADIDNINAGVPPGTPAEEGVRKVLRKMTLSDREAVADRKMSNQGMRELSEAIDNIPGLRKVIYAGKRIFEREDTDVPYTGVLPSNELITKGFLQDRVTEEDLADLLEKLPING